MASYEHDILLENIPRHSDGHNARAASGRSAQAHHGIISSGRTLAHFFRDNSLVAAAPAGGILGSLACFWFTHWLSQQQFLCPEWALYCSVGTPVVWITEHLALVQGIVNTVNSIALSLVAYATYNLAECSVWPLMALHHTKIVDIDRFVSAARGSLASSPLVLWRARGFYHTTIVIAVTSIAVLLHASSIVIGHAYTLVPVPTTAYRNLTLGGGFSSAFYQATPPGPLPGAVAYAVPVYDSWANGLSLEPLPQYREFVVDRANLSVVGDFSVNAVQVRKNISCSGRPINRIISNTTTGYFAVLTNQSDYQQSSVIVRIQPRLAVWVDSISQSSATRAVTRLVFAAVNGTIESGYSNRFYYPELSYYGISSLACDVDIELVDSSFCTGSPEQCARLPVTTVSTLAKLGTPSLSEQTATAWTSVWMGAVTSMYGYSVYGAQPMFQPGRGMTNVSVQLPLAYTAVTGYGSGIHDHWNIATIKNFIDVGSGALGLVLTRTWEVENVTVTSALDMPRLQTGRSFYLLLPLGVCLLSLLIMIAIAMLLHNTTHLTQMRLATSAYFIASTQNDDIRDFVRSCWSAGKDVSTSLSRLSVQYGRLEGGRKGLGRPAYISSLLGSKR